MQDRSGAKNMERREEAVEGADYEGLQHFIADSSWYARRGASAFERSGCRRAAASLSARSSGHTRDKVRMGFMC
jgi:hypothetical protein